MGKPLKLPFHNHLETCPVVKLYDGMYEGADWTGSPCVTPVLPGCLVPSTSPYRYTTHDLLRSQPGQGSVAPASVGISP